MDEQPNIACERCSVVLLVDDDLDMRESMRDALEGAGHQVVDVANGREALQRLSAGLAPCLVLLDLMMPVMDGRELVTVMRRDAAMAAIPVVMLSAWPEQASAIPGVQGWLKKPADLDDVLASVGRFCSKADATGLGG
jgi:CheY-like chemotaxis protein